MAEFGKIVILFGAVLVVVGAVLILLGRTPLGRLPGDLLIRRENVTFYFPLATSIIVSVVLSLILWLIYHFRR